MLCDRWRGCEKYREYIEPWVKYRKLNRKLKIYIVPSLIMIHDGPDFDHKTSDLTDNEDFKNIKNVSALLV